MPSAFILAVRSYPALLRAEQLAHQRCVLSNPLVLGEKPLTFPAPTTDRDRPVSRRSKPSSRTAFIGEQPNPWELLHPQDAMSRHRTNFHHFWWRRLCLHPVVDFRFRLGNHDLTFLEQESACCLDRRSKPFLSDQSLRGLSFVDLASGAFLRALNEDKCKDFPRRCLLGFVKAQSRFDNS